MHIIENRLLNYIRDNHLVSKGDLVVIAVSGGADSISLLHILHNIGPELGISLHIAHLDHMLRGPDSSRDAEFVRALACQLNLPATIGQRDVTSYRLANHLSLEEAAREVRYRFLEEVAGKIGGSSVAVAHTKNDQVETVILHLLRGSGLTGLVGLTGKSILRNKRVGPLTIVRPLLCLTRDEVEQYCHDLNLEYKTDSTNASLSLTRNRIRHKLLPQLRADFNPSIDKAVERLSKLVSDDVDYINTEAEKATNVVVYDIPNGVSIDRTKFRELHKALKRAVLRPLLASALGSPKDIEAVHIENMLELAEGEAGRSINLPMGLVFSSGYNELTLRRGAETIPLPPLDGEYELNVPGVTEIPGWMIEANVLEGAYTAEAENDENRFSQSFDLDLVGTSLTIRSRAAGDKFQPLGMKSEKSVKDFFIDAKVPQLWRSRIPIVVNHRQIIWVTGHRLDDRVKVTQATRQILRLQFQQRP